MKNKWSVDKIYVYYLWYHISKKLEGRTTAWLQKNNLKWEMIFEKLLKKKIVWLKFWTSIVQKGSSDLLWPHVLYFWKPWFKICIWSFMDM